ncbi:hypothetical protein MKW94_004308 [Papaver nudicaule]|uniref:Uncharacterized protein n=1 Tax=Papaver nudicaule TaxID=74823 RepID=A0AA41VAE2_PAPNU|nr:hypothetical protein [Papaver nudicaule]
MARHKVAAAKRIQKQLNINLLNLNASNESGGATSSSYLKFEHLVHNSLKKLDRRTRACYHGYIEFKPEILAWIMAVDASFLLEFLQVCAIKEGVYDNKVDLLSMISKFIRSSTKPLSYSFIKNQSSVGLGRKSAHNVILRDIMMLENQIPLFLLRKILEIQFASLEAADEVLRSMLIGIFKETSPIVIHKDSFLNIDEVTGYAHLLDFLYHMLVPHGSIASTHNKDDINHQDVAVDVGDDNDEDEHEFNGIEDGGGAKSKKESFGNTSHVKQLGKEVWKILSKLNEGPVSLVKKAVASKPVMLAAKLPWEIISRIPGIAILKQPIEKMFFSQQDKEHVKPDEKNNEGSLSANKPPLMEEINIPSVTELYESAGVRFAPTNGNIESIRFDEKTATIYLPILYLDVNSEVVLRNLVAYESSTASGPLVFARYTELMNGIIDTEADAKLLRESGVVLNHFKSDEEVAKLWNGMCKSIRLTKVPFLDKMIEDVNKFHSRRWRVKTKKFVKTYVFGSWKFLTFLAAVLLLLMTAFQAFCSVYNCSRFFHIPVVDQLNRN